MKLIKEHVERKTGLRRENIFDLLRIVSSVSVIIIHVSDSYILAFENLDIFGVYYTKHIFVSVLYNVLSRFAVPCFLMLSGAVVLSNERNKNYRYFYKKSFKNIGVQTIIFTLLYFAYSIIRAIMAIVLKIRGTDVLWLSVKNLLLGKPFYHMWYLYMLIGIYLLVPIIINFKHDIDEENFTKVVWNFLIWGCLSGWTSSHLLKWDIGASICYLGYFMVGYEIRKVGSLHKNNIKGLGILFFGVIIELLLACLSYLKIVEPYANNILNYIASEEPLSPLVMVASLLIFAGFSMMDVNKDFGKLSTYTFLIYLIHAGVWDLCKRAMVLLGWFKRDNRMIIPACIIIVFFISYICAILYEKLWGKLESKYKVSDRLLHFVRL